MLISTPGSCRLAAGYIVLVSHLGVEKEDENDVVED
jgi:hypothetical protein